jgi:hypothetical protein
VANRIDNVQENIPSHPGINVWVAGEQACEPLAIWKEKYLFSFAARRRRFPSTFPANGLVYLYPVASPFVSLNALYEYMNLKGFVPFSFPISVEP